MKQFRLHGANPEKLYIQFGIKRPEKIIDFSTNTNALPWSGHLTIDLKKTLCDYPDDECCNIRKILAKNNECTTENILVTNGANEAIYLIASYQKGLSNTILHPVYGEYDRALSCYGSNIKHISSIDALTYGEECVWLCNPCNPTGSFIEDNIIKNLLCKFPEKHFIIDEAYSEFMYNNSCNINYLDFNNVTVLRSLTKIYHLCGARIGYVFSNHKQIEKLKKRQPTWSVNSLAQQAALAFLSDTEFPNITRKYYKNEVPRVIMALKDIGYNILPTTVNYFLVETENDIDFIQFMLKRGIVVRHTRNFPELAGRYVRIAVRTKEENDILIKEMGAYKVK